MMKINNYGILGISIGVAFFIGVLTANPIVEAAGGWQLAVDDLQNQIDAIPQSPKAVNLQDTDDPNCEGNLDGTGFGWCPFDNASAYRFIITDSSVTTNSVVTATVYTNHFGTAVDPRWIINDGSFEIIVIGTRDGQQLNYVVTNP